MRFDQDKNKSSKINEGVTGRRIPVTPVIFLFFTFSLILQIKGRGDANERIQTGDYFSWRNWAHV